MRNLQNFPTEIYEYNFRQYFNGDESVSEFDLTPSSLLKVPNEDCDHCYLVFKDTKAFFNNVQYLYSLSNSPYFLKMIAYDANDGSIQQMICIKRAKPLTSIIGQIDDSQISIMFYILAKAVLCLHSNGIAHKGISSTSIFIDENNFPLLGGFHSSVNVKVKECKDELSDDIRDLGVTFIEILQKEEMNQSERINLMNNFKQYILNESNLQAYWTKENEKLFGLIKEMCSQNHENRKTIAQVCKLLENKDYWLPNTNENLFNQMKKELENYEFKDNKRAEKESIKTLLENFDPNTCFYQIYNNFSKSHNLNTEIAFLLGFLHLNGLKTYKDTVVGLKYLKYAKENGNIKANIFFNQIQSSRSCSLMEPSELSLFKGAFFEIEGKINEAINLYYQAINDGNNEGFGRLGSLLIHLNGFKEQGEQFLQEGISHHDPLSHIEFAKYLIQKANPNDKDKISLHLKKGGHPAPDLLLLDFYLRICDFDKAKEIKEKYRIINVALE